MTNAPGSRPGTNIPRSSHGVSVGHRWELWVKKRMERLNRWCESE
jgi:hypothetical protein